MPPATDPEQHTEEGKFRAECHVCLFPLTHEREDRDRVQKIADQHEERLQHSTTVKSIPN